MISQILKLFGMENNPPANKETPVTPVQAKPSVPMNNGWWGKKPPSNDIDDLTLRLLEEGTVRYEDYEVLEMVKEKKLPFDEYQELIADRHNDRSRFVKFGSQVVFSASVVAFCMSMIIVERNQPEKNGEGIYLPIISGILGYWLPNPDYSKIMPKKTTNTTSTTNATTDTTTTGYKPYQS